MNGICIYYERRKIENVYLFMLVQNKAKHHKCCYLMGVETKKKRKVLFCVFTTERYSHGRTCALLNSVQKFIEMQGWLLLTFFLCLHNQLSYFNSIIVEISEKRDS